MAYILKNKSNLFLHKAPSLLHKTVHGSQTCINVALRSNLLPITSHYREFGAVNKKNMTSPLNLIKSKLVTSPKVETIDE